VRLKKANTLALAMIDDRCVKVDIKKQELAV